MARKKTTNGKRPIQTYEHRDKTRANNPPAGLVTPDTDPDSGQKKKRYAYDPHLHPQLVWAVKAERNFFKPDAVLSRTYRRTLAKAILHVKAASRV